MQPSTQPTSKPSSGAAVRGGRVGGRAVVTINSVDALCTDATAHCEVTFSAAATPRVTAVSVVNGVANITGQGLVPPLRVWFGTVPASNATLRALDASGHTITVRPPAQTAGTVSVFVHTGLGNAENAWSFSYVKHVAIAGITASGTAGGSTAGGDVVVITGDGFSPTLLRNVVAFGTANGVVLAANYTRLVVSTPPNAAGKVDVTVTVVDPFFMGSVDYAKLAQGYTYATAATPVLTSVTPAAVHSGSTLTIAGTGFGVSGTAGNAVTIGGAACAVTVWTATQVTCTVGSTPAGVHNVQLVVGGAGLAKPSSSNLAVTVSLAVTTMQSFTVGPGGGAALTIAGAGFAPTAGPGSNSTNNVTVCGVNATVIRATSTSLTFAVPTLPTVTANDLYNTYESRALTPAAVYPASAAAAFDGLTSTKFWGCDVTADLGPWSVGVVSKIRFFPLFGDYAPWYSSVFAAANSTKGPWTTLYKVPSKGVLDGWNYQSLGVHEARLKPLPRYRYFKWSASNSDCQGMEIEYSGRRFTVNEGRACPVNVTVITPAQPPYTTTVTTSSLHVANVNVESTNIPVVHSIQPRYGTALGGDRVQITGQGFALGTGVANVTLNGMLCKVRAFNATFIACVTTPRRSIEPPSVGVLVGGMGLALVNDTSTCYFSYLDRWSQLTTWYNNEPPGEGDTVVVPKGQAILVDVSPPRLFLVLIQGEMTFDATVPHIAFNASYIAVLGGKLTIGTEAEPLRNKVTITLHGDRTTSIELPGT